MNTLTLSEHLTHLLEQYLMERTIQSVHIDPSVLAYRWIGGKSGQLTALDVKFGLDLDDLLGIDVQKEKLIANTHQFLAGLPANHVLMTGARGVGKSSLIRAL